MSESSRLPDSANLAFAEAMYDDYQRDPDAVPPDWRRYFEQQTGGPPDGSGNGHAPNGHHANGHAGIGPSFQPASLFNPPRAAPRNGEVQARHGLEMAEVAALQDRVDQLIRAHRVRGHMIAHLDPLELPRPYPPELDPEYYGFTQADMGRPFSCETLHPGPLPLHEIVQRLRNTYCRRIGVQFMHIDDLDVRLWLQEQMERTLNRRDLDREQQIRILTRLTDAVSFEEFIRRKFVGAKSFSLEGAESLIPLLDLTIEEAGGQGVEQIVLAMAHRGRLNVLANIMGKNPRAIFREFEDADPDLFLGRGDVKYHLGFSNDWETRAGHNVHLSLSFNPSHLECVNPVALGRMRAKQDRYGDVARSRGMVILVHGDAAFAGEGVVQETLNLSELDGYGVGGTLHIVVNNQIGFTTPPRESRASSYATDVAKMLQIPIFHVNGEDPEAVAQVVHLALDFRAAFHRDVVIDMYAYRRLGHNESDEPAFTQPLMYRAIEKRKSVREAYLEHLQEMGQVTRQDADTIAERRRQHLEQELAKARSGEYRLPKPQLKGLWAGYLGGPESGVPDVDTGVPRERLASLLESTARLPEGFKVHPKIGRILQTRRAMAQGTQPLDWAAAEALAFATLATEPGNPARVRLTGQDSERGTFSHRHAVLHDIETDWTYHPLQYLAPDQAPVEIRNSPLSEMGVLGFEYGYSLDCPHGLVGWEAQFGDFWNVAQVIVDQFIASAEDKWLHLSGLVMLLPHGFEGMGPEHSSARLERFLALAAEDNMQVVYPTTPAQYFHLLRRQVLRKWRKPLVVMSPKSLLRHLEAVSELDEMTTGTFQRVLPDALDKPGRQVSRILLCSGKIYYELDNKRESLKRDDVAILRVEQLYPLAPEVLQKALAPYPEDTPVCWVQEEPENMGAWRHMKLTYSDTLFSRRPFAGITRPASASPATGSHSSHKIEQEQILAQAFGG